MAASSLFEGWNHAIGRLRKGGTAVVVGLALGCTPDPVLVSDQCVATTEPILLRTSAGFPGRWSMGMLEGQLIFSYTTSSGLEGDPVEARAQWFDQDLQPVTDDFALAAGTAMPPFEWLTFDGAVWAQIWGEEDAGAVSPLREQVSIWRLLPRSTHAVRTEVALPVTRAFDGSDLTPIDIGATSVTAGADGRAPAAVGHGAPTFVLSGIPRTCPGPPVANFSRLIVFDEGANAVDLSGEEACALDGTVWAHNMRLVSLHDGGLGVLFRLGISIGQGYIYYSRIGPDLTLLDTPPIRVDWTTYAWNIPGGFQPQAVALGSGTLLFTNRDPESSYNVCQELRLVEPDGSSPRDAPYQMPCRNAHGALIRRDWADTLSQWVVVEPLASGHAIIAYGERPYHDSAPFTRRVDTRVRWEEGVFLHTIDEAGRRSSDIVRVTPPQSTALADPLTPRTADSGPIPGDFEVQAVTEGDDVVVAWRDNRPDAPGYYARRYRCTENPE